MAFSNCSRLVLIALGVFVVGGFASQTLAADEKAQEVDETTQSVQERVEDFTKDFDAASKQHFYSLYGSYNLIQVVEGVRMQVGEAIDKCGEVNPDMKDALQSRYKDWDAVLAPIMDDANANVDNMIIAQDYAKSRKIKKLFKFVDKKRISKEKEAKKFPVTTPEGCQYLLDKMDDTEKDLTKLLKSTLVSLPNAMINSDDVDSGEEGE